jgi:CarboxypepD_reg-like domain
VEMQGSDKAEDTAASDARADRPGAPQETKSPLVRDNVPQATANARRDYVANVSAESIEAETAAPPPIMLKDSQAPPVATEMADAIAVEEKPSAAKKEENDASKAKQTEAFKKVEPAAMPGATASRTITGKVMDENGDPLIGAIVATSDTKTGTVTDVDGNYSLNIPGGTVALVFSFTGYSTVEVFLGKNNRVDMTMSGSAELSEVVVTGYSPGGGEAAAVESPRPVDGFRAYKKYVSENMRHPEADRQPRPRQVVRVKFTLQPDGSLSKFTAKGDAPQAYKDEAIRLLREGPRWRGTQGTTASFRFVFD